MRGSARRLREKRSAYRGLLLDTMYLLPIFGVDVELETSLHGLLEEGDPLYYNPLSLVEIKWVYYRLVRLGVVSITEARRNYIEGFRALLRDKRFRRTPVTTPAIERVADDLHDMGIKDYFDRMIAATAIVGRLRLVTDDKDLKDIEERYREWLSRRKGG